VTQHKGLQVGLAGIELLVLKYLIVVASAAVRMALCCPDEADPLQDEGGLSAGEARASSRLINNFTYVVQMKPTLHQMKVDLQPVKLRVHPHLNK